MHISVLGKEAIQYLNPKPNENFVDCTFGWGGHTIEILKRNAPRGQVLAIELDPELLKCLRQEFKYLLGKRLILVHGNFADFKKIVAKYQFRPVNGVLLDLGMSSWHIEKSGRGFTFQKDEPLLMRYDWETQNSELRTSLTAREIVNLWPEKEIAKILQEYGQEKFAKRIAKEIIKTRDKKPIETTFQLVEIIKRATPSRYHHQRIHFATRTFQALRIAVNDELENFKKVLGQALEVLEKKGRLVVISFHSLEDRILKNFFKKEKFKNNIKILTKKPVIPSKSEIILNPRSRAAKLRACKKI